MSRERWRAFRSTIVSRSARASPAARTAPNDEPYSTMRCSSRCHHTRCGMWCRSGCEPVAIELRHTGVSDGNVDVARRYSPCSARKRSAGVSAASNIDGVSPSMTISTTFFGGVLLGKGAQAGVPVRRAAAQARAEQRHRERLEVAEHGNERERGADERCPGGERRGPAARSASTERPADERRRAERAASGADEAARRLVPLAEREADDHRDGDRGDERSDGAAQRTRHRDTDGGAEADEDADRVPVAHCERGYRWAKAGHFFDNPVCDRWETLVMTGDARPVLMFFTSSRSGPARRMESLVAHIARKERDRLRVIQVDVDQRLDLAEKLRVE